MLSAKKYVGLMIILTIVSFIGLTFLSSSCMSNKQHTTVEKHSERIIGKECTTYEEKTFYIIKVDGVEYISTYSGGICPLIR